jgi:archaellum component FlaC
VRNNQHSENAADEMSELQRELKDLEEALARQNPPLGQRTRQIAETKVTTLREQIKTLELRSRSSH